MGAPHNTKRYGELWNHYDLAIMSAEIERYLDLIIVSGGWAWHYMSPAHDELKHAHDHKDADVFVAPENLWKLLDRLKADGYEKTWTRFDGVTDIECFSDAIAKDLIARWEIPKWPTTQSF